MERSKEHSDIAGQSYEELAARCPHLAQYDPFEATHLADPYPLWATAQREAPVFYVPSTGFWVVTGRTEVLDVLRDAATYSSTDSLNLKPVPEALSERLPYGWPSGFPSLINTDPPVHTPIRKLAQAAITPREVAKREPEIREISSSLIEEFAADGACDLMSQYLIPFPVVVIARVLGVPDEDTGAFGQWAEDAFMMPNPTLGQDEIIERGSRLADLKDYLEEQVESRRKDPKDDLMSRLVHAQVDGEPTLTTEQVVSVAAQLLVGGNETTTHLIGNCMMLLRGRFSSVWERVCEDPSLIPPVIEETLRIKSSVRGLFRTATRDVELGGETVPAGSKLWLLIAAADHDESVFENPTDFDPDRGNLREHIAFGKWTHFCIGAPLARLEAKIALEHLSERFPEIQIDPDQALTWLPSPFTQGVERLEASWPVPASTPGR